MTPQFIEEELNKRAAAKKGAVAPAKGKAAAKPAAPKAAPAKAAPKKVEVKKPAAAAAKKPEVKKPEARFPPLFPAQPERAASPAAAAA